MRAWTANDIDAIVLATSTADLTFPSAATMVQHAIGNTTGYAFDVQAVCAGFVYALANANALIVSGQADRVLVIGAETFSRIMDWTDRGDLRAVRRRRRCAWCLRHEEGDRAQMPIAASCRPT